MSKKIIIKFCQGSSCQAWSQYHMEKVEASLQYQQFKQKVSLDTCSCQGQCQKGPNVVIEIDEKKEIMNYSSPSKIIKMIKKNV